MTTKKKFRILWGNIAYMILFGGLLGWFLIHVLSVWSS